jgi:exopolysaccharide biosynthesis polyprenyl glycosylphosphotransferase
MAYTATQKNSRWRMRTDERRAILLLGDLIVASLCLLISLLTWGKLDWLHMTQQFLNERIPIWFFFLPVIWLILNIEMYDTRRSGRRSETIKGISVSAGISLAIYLFVFFFAPKGELPRVGVATFIVASAVLTIAWRFIYIAVFTAPEFLRRVLIVGAGKAGSTLVQVIDQMHPKPYFIVGLIDDDPGKSGSLVEGYKIWGGCDQLMNVVKQQEVSDVIFAISNDMRPDMFRALLTAEEEGVEITTLPTVYEKLLGRVPILLLNSDWILRSFVDYAHASTFYELVKRLLDVIGGFIGVVLTALVFPFIALAIYLDTGRPVLFTQARLGQNGDEYSIIKFRTMVQDAEKDGKARVTVKNDTRITRVGRFLRKSRLDELPQFINVLRGEMSLVGPRAERSELVSELQAKVPFYRARLLVKPGLSGWAQVNFGYAATVEDTAVKLEYDLYYIKHRNLLLDFIILMRTFGTVIGFKGQ